MKILAVIILWIFVALGGCGAEAVERDFFQGDIATRNSRLMSYQMEDQWRIFLYGNQVIHPPATGLAEVLAHQGEPMLQFILRKLDVTNNDLDYRDSMVVFQTMQWHGYYPICDDIETLSIIKNNQNKIVNSAWRKVYGEMFVELCRFKQSP